MRVMLFLQMVVAGCALMFVTACGVPEASYHTVVYDLLCEREVECNPLLLKEECLLIAPPHIGLDCEYDAKTARDCEKALLEATCMTDDLNGRVWFETPEVCESVWSCD